MKFITIATLIIILGIVWGGFSFFLSKAVKYEKIKNKNGKK